MKPSNLLDPDSIIRPILFTKTDCEKCEGLKHLLAFEPTIYHHLDVVTLDSDNADALSTLAYHSLVQVAEKSLPILLTRDLQIVIDMNRIAELLGIPISEEAGIDEASSHICADDACGLNL